MASLLGARDAVASKEKDGPLIGGVLETIFPQRNRKQELENA